MKKRAAGQIFLSNNNGDRVKHFEKLSRLSSRFFCTNQNVVSLKESLLSSQRLHTRGKFN